MNYKSLYYATEFLLLVNTEDKDQSEELQEQIEEAKRIIKEKLKIHKEPTQALCKLLLDQKFSLNKAITSNQDEHDKAASSLNDGIIPHTLRNTPKLLYQANLFSSLTNSYLLEELSKGKLIEVCEKLINSEFYEMHYIKLDSPATFAQLHQNLSKANANIFMYGYCKALQEDKLSFISLMYSLKEVQQEWIKPFHAKALEYLNDLRIDEFHPFRLGLEDQK